MPRRGTVLPASLLALVVAVLLGGCSAGAGDPTTATPAPVPSSTPGASAPTRYVALGDSYTASPSTGPDAGPPPGCARSTNDYPHLVAAATGAALTDVSCSGATTADLTGPQATRQGTNPPQLDAVTGDTGLVTVQIGGNDIGFGEIVSGCVSGSAAGSPCRDRYTAGGTDRLRERIDALGPRLSAVLAAVHRRAPGARVAVVGYPSLLPAEGPGCYPVLPYTPGDVAYLRGVVTALNRETAERAADGGATFVDTATPTAGHDMCQADGVRWIEGLYPVAPAAPVHPNALGQQAVARAVLATLGGR